VAELHSFVNKNRNMKLKPFAFCLIYIVIIGTSCSSGKKMTNNFNYLQQLDSITKSANYEEPLLAVGDNITVQVIAGSLAQQDAAVFNMVGASTTQSINGAITTNGSLYQIDKDGYIEMPRIGKVKVEGLSKRAAEELINSKIKLSELIKEPMVVVKYTNFKVNVLGEVKKPGVQLFRVEKVNILEAIAEAGDLTEYGKREDIIVMRQNGDKWETIKIDLKNTNFFQSQVFYLRNNDFVYVPANEYKIKLMKNDPNLQKNLSIAALAMQTLFFIVQAALVIRSFR
jgi:polysaccharide export outer membrane protein